MHHDPALIMVIVVIDDSSWTLEVMKSSVKHDNSPFGHLHVFQYILNSKHETPWPGDNNLPWGSCIPEGVTLVSEINLNDQAAAIIYEGLTTYLARSNEIEEE